MSYKINDKIYERIESKIKNGIFTKGKNYSFPNVNYDRFVNNISFSLSSTNYNRFANIISFIPINERTPELYSTLILYGKCKFADVPVSSRTREFFLNTFTDNDVFEYIQNHIADFDRQFFKDLIATNKYVTFFRTCFEIMPLEYIDEEMCSLAILNSTDWIDNTWFYDVYKRKSEVLTADLWKLGARLYARVFDGKNEFLNITPNEYKDNEYYKEMCSCNFNCGVELIDNKGKIMDTIPQKILTIDFLWDLLLENINNIANFNEKALETKIFYFYSEKIIEEKIWQFAVKLKGSIIEYIQLNDERVNFFLKHYAKDSIEYDLFFKDKYKTYLEEKKNIKSKTEPKIDKPTNNKLLVKRKTPKITKAIFSQE